MKRVLNVIFFLLLTVLSLSAQEIGIEILDTQIKGRSIPRSIAARLTEILKTELSNSQRFIAVGEGNIDQAMRAQNAMKTEGFRKQETLAQGKLQVTHYQLRCNLLEYDMEKKYREDSETKRKEFKGYQSWMTYSYELISVVDGSTVLSRNIKVQSGTEDTKELAISDLASKTNGWLSRFLMLAFPIESDFLEVSTNKKKNKITKAILIGGKEKDIYGGCRFKILKVKVLTDSHGNEHRDEVVVGYLKVKEVKATTCNVKPANASSSKKILSHYKKGEVLQVVSDVKWPDPEKPAELKGMFQDIVSNPFKKNG